MADFVIDLTQSNCGLVIELSGDETVDEITEIVESKVFDKNRLQNRGHDFNLLRTQYLEYFSLYDNDKIYNIWKHEMNNDGEVVHEEELLKCTKHSRSHYHADGIRIGELKDASVIKYHSSYYNPLSAVKPSEKFIVEIHDRDFYLGLHHFYNELVNVSINIKITIEKSGTKSEKILPYQLSYYYIVSHSTDENCWVSTTDPYSRGYYDGILVGGDSVMLCPDGDYTTSSNMPMADDKYIFLGSAKNPKRDGSSLMDTEHCFLLQICPVFEKNPDNNPDFFDVLPSFDILSATVDSSDNRKVKFFLDTNHDFTTHSDVRIDTNVFLNLDADTGQNEYAFLFDSTHAQNEFSITYPYHLDPQTFLPAAGESFVGKVTRSEDAMKRFASDLSSVGANKVQEYRDLINQKYANLEMFKRQECKIHDRGNTVRWINEQCRILGFPYCEDNSYFDLKTYQGVVLMKDYFKSVNTPLFEALELQKPCDARVPVNSVHEKMTSLCDCSCNNSNCSCTTHCGCFTWGMKIFEEVMNQDTDTIDQDVDLDWDSILDFNSFALENTPGEFVKSDYVGKYTGNELTLDGNVDTNFSFKVKSKHSVYVRVDVLDSNNDPIEGAWYKYGTFVDYILTGGSVFSLTYNTMTPSCTIAWDSPSSTTIMCNKDSEVFLKNTLQNVAKIRLTVKDAKTLFGEWMNAGSTLPSEYGRSDGVTTIDSLAAQIQSFFALGSGIKFTVGAEAKFGFEFSALNGLIQLKIGSLIGISCDLSSLDGLDLKFGMFGSLGVEAGDVFSATAEIQAIQGYKIRFNQFSRDLQAMIWEEINSFIPPIIRDTSPAHKELIKKIKQKNTRKTLVKVTFQALGISAEKSYEESVMYSPTTWHSKTEIDWKDEFAYNWDIAGGKKRQVSHYREVKHDIHNGAMSITHSVGYKWSDVKKLFETLEEDELKDKLLWAATAEMYLVFLGVQHSFASLGAFNQLGSTSSNPITEFLSNLSSSVEENKSLDYGLNELLLGLGFTGSALAMAVKGIKELYRFTDQESIPKFSIFNFDTHHSKKANSFVETSKEFTARLGFKRDYVSPPGSTVLGNLTGNLDPNSPQTSAYTAQNPSSTIQTIKNYIDTDPTGSNFFHDILIQLGFEASISLNLPRTPFPPLASFLQWRPVLDAKIYANLDVQIFELFYSLGILDSNNHLTNLNHLKGVLDEMYS